MRKASAAATAADPGPPCGRQTAGGRRGGPRLLPDTDLSDPPGNVRRPPIQAAWRHETTSRRQALDRRLQPSSGVGKVCLPAA